MLFSAISEYVPLCIFCTEVLGCITKEEVDIKARRYGITVDSTTKDISKRFAGRGNNLDMLRLRDATRTLRLLQNEFLLDAASWAPVEIFSPCEDFSAAVLATMRLLREHELSTAIMGEVCRGCKVELDGSSGSGSGSKKGFKCSTCQTARYCNTDCQRKDWANHKTICSKIHELHGVIGLRIGPRLCILTRARAVLESRKLESQK